MIKKQQAEDLHSQAMQLEAEDEERALQLYQQALELNPEKSESWYNIGLIYKYRGEWQASFEANLKAYKLDNTNEATCWNLAIAATALQDWQMARQVWHHLGLAIEEGDTEIEADFGITPVRLNADAEAEVVWARRIDPVRARIINIPYPESNYCYGDVVLHDGAAVGYRTYKGKELPVFNVFFITQPSALSTWQLEVVASCEQDITDLLALFKQAEIPCESWQDTIQFLCRECSEGIPHHHDKQPVETDTIEFNPQRLLGIACVNEEPIQQILTKWKNSQRSVKSVVCALQGLQEAD